MVTDNSYPCTGQSITKRCWITNAVHLNLEHGISTIMKKKFF